jgi:hypothetical protein
VVKRRVFNVGWLKPLKSLVIGKAQQAGDSESALNQFQDTKGEVQ